ncbi:MAG: hypothetical protein DWQ04_32765 [Chloroflexi bacterium]|nr:MAG: hypothetical protein DWQ04_32765 [Chloroflexota bacterium]
MNNPNDLTPEVWHEVKNAPFEIQGITGENTKGVAVYNGSSVCYMNSYDNQIWNKVKDAPFHIQGITGDNANGVAVYNGSSVRYMNSYDNQIWNKVKDAPFHIQGITGENTKGVAVYNGSSVRYMNSYDNQIWNKVKDAPFHIQGITGNNATGVAVFNGSSVCYMNSYDNQIWNELEDAPFDIQAITGDNANGVIIFNMQQQRAAYMNSYNENVWHEFFSKFRGSAGRSTPFEIQGVTGDNANGMAAFNGKKVAFDNNFSWKLIETFPGWLPIQIAFYYSFPLLEFSGKGQSIAILSFGGKIDMDELKNDFRAMRMAMPNIKEVIVNGPIPPRQDNGGSVETHLDVEIIGALCPDAQITIYRAPNKFSEFANAVNRAVADNNSIISISWGAAEDNWGDNRESLEAALAKAANKGVTVCVSSGDGGSSDVRSGNRAAQAKDGMAHVNYPASSPYVLACGGTELLRGQVNFGYGTIPVTQEIVWNNSNIGGGATGGGVSNLFPMPQWQIEADINIPNANNEKTGRVVPDVSGLAAGRDWAIFESGDRELTGGTSAVAPLWASLIALINEKRDSVDKAPLGFINESLYELASDADLPLFNDIITGNNKPTSDYPGYEAEVGFDACTGWGTPRINLFLELAALD